MAGASRLVWGVGPVDELLRRRAREVTVVYVSPARKARQRGADPVAALAAAARNRGVVVETRTRAELDALVGAGGAHARHQHQGVVAVAGEYTYAAIEDITALVTGDLAAGRLPLVVALDSVQDPHNLGAIVRSAHVLGARALVIPQDRAAQVTATVTKVSAGATEHVPIAQVTNLVRALGLLKDAGLWLAGLAAGPDARPLHALDARLPLCLVLGAEGTGIRPLVARACDFQVEIPMAGPGVGSLNVSVAAGIALYEVVRQRAGSVADPGAAD